MTGLHTITVRQPWASLIAAGVKTIETRSWATRHRGPLVIHASKKPAPAHAWPPATRMPKEVLSGRSVATTGVRSLPGDGCKLPLGAIVATAVLSDCVPMVQFLSRGPGHEPHPAWTPFDGSGIPPVPCLAINHDASRLTVHRPYRDATDQLPVGDFRAGRWAWLLDDVKATTERCPACWPCDLCGVVDFKPWSEDPRHRMCISCGHVCGHPPCPVCAGVRHCDPVPAEGRLGLWQWQHHQEVGQ